MPKARKSKTQHEISNNKSRARMFRLNKHRGVQVGEYTFESYVVFPAYWLRQGDCVIYLWVLTSTRILCNLRELETIDLSVLLAYPSGHRVTIFVNLLGTQTDLSSGQVQQLQDQVHQLQDQHATDQITISAMDRAFWNEMAYQSCLREGRRRGGHRKRN